MSQVVALRTVLGDSRPVTHRYEDGSFDCPYCSAAVVYPKIACENPACDTSPYWTPERLAEARSRLEMKAAEERRRQADHAAAMHRITQERSAHLAWQQAQVVEANNRGACLQCLFQPGWQRVKFIRHRKACPKRRAS